MTPLAILRPAGTIKSLAQTTFGTAAHEWFRIRSVFSSFPEGLLVATCQLLLVWKLRTVKIWTTIDRGLKRELKSLTTDLGFKTETECVREALRQGIQTLKAQRSVFGMLAKRKDSILQSAGLLEEEYAKLNRGELELKIKSQWGKVEQSA